MENNVTTHQNNSVHGDDSLLTVKVDNDTFIDAVMDGVITKRRIFAIIWKNRWTLKTDSIFCCRRSVFSDVSNS